jgi:predicted NBD/HSP70 family sugar kinase
VLPLLSPSPVVDSPASAAHLLWLVRTGRARSRSDLIELSGLSRSSVSTRVEQLLAAGLLHEAGPGRSTGGRPPRLLSFNRDAGRVVGIDLGVTSVDVAVTDLAGSVLAATTDDLDIADGPDRVLARTDELTAQLLRSLGCGKGDVRAIGIGVPGPVEHATGRLVHPPVMPGWHDARVPDHFADYGCAVLVDNDVNVIAVGEQSRSPQLTHFLVVKMGTGIGCGIVLDGHLYRGSAGSAGDIGHIHVDDERTVLCACGNENCLEAVAGGAALAREAAQLGLPVATPRDLIGLTVEGDRQAVALVREAGRRIGEVLAALVNFANPSCIVVTGGLARAGNPLLAGIREAVYRRSLPLAARSLEIRISDRVDDAGRIGAARMAIDGCLDEAHVDALLAASN